MNYQCEDDTDGETSEVGETIIFTDVWDSCQDSEEDDVLLSPPSSELLWLKTESVDLPVTQCSYKAGLHPVGSSQAFRQFSIIHFSSVAVGILIL